METMRFWKQHDKNPHIYKQSSKFSPTHIQHIDFQISSHQSLHHLFHFNIRIDKALMKKLGGKLLESTRRLSRWTSSLGSLSARKLISSVLAAWSLTCSSLSLRLTQTQILSTKMEGIPFQRAQTWAQEWPPCFKRRWRRIQVREWAAQSSTPSLTSSKRWMFDHPSQLFQLIWEEVALIRR